jgi:oligopeptide transport system ATP-binding protein
MAEGKPLLLQVRNLQVHFPVQMAGAWPWAPGGKVKAVDGVSFDLHQGQTLGVVGESGCGKSTLARALLNLHPATAGSMVWNGQQMVGASKADWMAVRKDIQMVFQDPLASLNPRMTAGQIIGEPLRIHRPEVSAADRANKVRALMDRVGLTPHQVNRYPHEFSGGQCQRIGIARALILEPKLVVCDEPVSALDVSIQAQIVNLLAELQKDLGLALLFIAHDLAVVRHISQRVMVMYLGRTMEIASRDALYSAARHPYSRALLSAIPILDPEIERNRSRQLLAGELPSPLNPPSGCVFHTRCPIAQAQCSAAIPDLQSYGQGNRVACHFSELQL